MHILKFHFSLWIITAAILLPNSGFAHGFEDFYSGSMSCAASRHDALDLIELREGGPGFASPGAQRHLPPDRVVDFLHLKGDLKVRPARGTISGKVMLSFTPVADPVKEIIVHAGKRLIIQQVTNQEDKNLDFVHDGETLTIKLSSALAHGQKAIVSIIYDGKPQEGMHFVKAKVGGREIPEVWTQGETTFNRDWLPLWDYPNDRFTSELIVRVPPDFTVIGNGRLLSEKIEFGDRVFHYHQEQDHVGYLISLVIGKMVVQRDASKEPPLWYAVYPEDVKHIGRGYGETRAIMDFLDEITEAPYPYAKYSQAVASAYPLGGMENISASTMNRDYVIYDASAGLVYDGMPLVAHEAAHQWFGDMLTCRDWAHMWLNEGFASYLEVLYTYQAHGPERAIESMNNSKRWYLGETQRYKRPVVTYTFDDASNIFDAHTYSKGGWILHMLRAKLGHKLFVRGLKLYVKRHTDGLVETSDFIRAMEDATGKNLHDFFEQWVFRAGHPELEVSIQDMPGNKQIKVHIKQKNEKPFHFPLQLHISYENGAPDSRSIEVRGRDQIFYLQRRAAPRTVELDPEGVLLKPLDLKVPEPMLRAQSQLGTSIQTRMDAANALGKLGGNMSNVSALDRTLNSSEQYRSVRVAAANALGKIATTDACRSLVKGLESDNAFARRAASRNLAECQNADHIQLLIDKSKRDSSVHVISAALESLGKYDERAPRSVLEKNLGRTSWIDIIATGAVRGMVHSGQAWALNTLTNHLTKKKASRRVKVAILRGLGEFPAYDQSTEKKVLNAVRKALNSENSFVIREALRTLAKLGTSEDFGRLEEGIRKLPSKWHKREIRRWREGLQKHVANQEGDAASRKRSKQIEKNLEKLESRIRDLEAREKPLTD